MSGFVMLRQKCFWMLDIFKGSTVKKHLRDIKEIIENPQSANSISRKKFYLNKLLNHAVNTCVFYSDYSDFKSISDFPVINKNMIRDNFDNFSSSKFKTNLITVSTSGSTGAPFSIRIDKNKHQRNTADTIYFSRRSGYRVGQKVVYIKIWGDNQKFSLFSKFGFKNIYPQSVFNLSEKDMAKLIDSIQKDTCKTVLLSYSSALEKICKYLDGIGSKRLNSNVVSIIAISEALNPYVKRATKKYFGIEAVSRYSNNENGILAQQDAGDNHNFVINEASYYIELLDFKLNIINNSGKLGSIVVTDLHNYATPLIRYDTGDLGILEYDEYNTPYLSVVNGRKLDAIYDTNGHVVPSHVSYKLCKYGEYKQFQLIQSGKKEYLIKLNTDMKVDEASIQTEFKGYFGNDAEIKIEYVDEIPLLSSGKRQEVLNTYHIKH